MADFTSGDQIKPQVWEKNTEGANFCWVFWGGRCSFLCFGIGFSMKSMEIPHGSWFLYHFGKTSSAVFPDVFFVTSFWCFLATRSPPCRDLSTLSFCVWSYNTSEDSIGKTALKRISHKKPQVSAPHHHVPPEVFFRDGTAVLETSSCQPENTWNT